MRISNFEARPFAWPLSVLLLLSASEPALAQSRGTEIVVVGTRERAVAVDEIEPERTFSENDVSSYGASTVGEVLDEIAAENGDTGEPVLFVNGRPITDPGDIVDYPAEAIDRIDVLPRGAASRLGASPDKRAYNVVLKKVFKSDIGAARELASTGENYAAWGAELFVTRFSGAKRFNLTLRVRDEDELLESDRGVLQPALSFPYSIAGNLVADPRLGGSEIDPALSVAAGHVVTVAGLPSSMVNPALAAFVTTADKPTTTDIGRFRTLRPDLRSYEASFGGNVPLAEWLSTAVTGRYERTSFVSLQGLAAGLFVVPPSTSSPFSQPVAIARYFENDLLRRRSRSQRGALGLAFNATWAKWQATLRGDYRYSDWRSTSLFQGLSATTPIDLNLGAGVDPFAADLSTYLALRTDQSLSRTLDYQLQASATGPLLELPAGPLRANLNTSLRRVDQFSRSDSQYFANRTSFGRNEMAGQASFEIPLTSRERETLGAIGDLSLTLDYGATDVSGRGTARRSSIALAWKPVKGVQLQGAVSNERTVPDPQLIGDAINVTEGVRYFDVLTGQTVDVALVYGGNPDLRREKKVLRRLSATAQIPAKFDLQLNAEFLSTAIHNPISSLPPASADLMAAFPERFQRDASGRLILVDSRPINFDSRSTEQIHWGANFNLPLAPQPIPGSSSPPNASRLKLQGNLSHTMYLTDRIVARTAYPSVDLLEGGAVGFGGGTTRHQFDASLALSDREVGIRGNLTWRSESLLSTGTSSRLRFSPLTIVTLRGFADLGQVWRERKWLKGTKISLNVVNLFDVRQEVRDQAGVTPLSYQPAYRDALGRTVELELRRTF